MGIRPKHLYFHPSEYILAFEREGERERGGKKKKELDFLGGHETDFKLLAFAKMCQLCFIQIANQLRVHRNLDVVVLIIAVRPQNDGVHILQRIAFDIDIFTFYCRHDSFPFPRPSSLSLALVFSFLFF